MADEFFFAGEAEPFCAGSGGHDQGFGFDPFSVDTEANGFFCVLKRLNGCELEARAEASGLRLDVHDEVGALDAFGEAGKVFDEGGGGELSTWLMAFENEWGQVCAGGVNSGSEAGATRADNDEFFHDVGTLPKISAMANGRWAGALG